MALVGCAVVIEHAEQNLIVNHTSVCDSLDVVCVVVPVGLPDQNTKVASVDEDCCFQMRDPPRSAREGSPDRCPPTGVADNTSTRYARRCDSVNWLVHASAGACARARQRSIHARHNGEVPYRG